MNKENKKEDNEIKNDMTKATTLDNTLMMTELVSPMVEVHRYTPLYRHDFNMNVLENWSEIRTKKQPKRRSFHSSFIHNSYFYVYGGVDIITGKLGDLQRIKFGNETPSWENIIPKGVSLEPLAYQAGCLVNDIYFIFGGQNSKFKTVNTVYFYDLENNKLDKITPKETEFPLLENHSANLYKTEIIIFGGYSHGLHQNDIYSFDTLNKTFKKLTNYQKNEKNIPENRINHSAIILNDDLYIFGGETKEAQYLNDMWKFDLINNQWSKVVFANDDIPKGRSGHSKVLFEDKFFIFGGKSGYMNEANDLWRFDLKTKRFTILHDTLIEQYSDKELLENSPKNEDKDSKGKTFKILTKKDIPALNPIIRSYKNLEIANKKKESMNKTVQMQEFKNNCEKELLRSPRTSFMKRSVIYNLETDFNTVLYRLSNLFQTKSHKSLIQDNTLSNTPPLPRDGHSAILYGNYLVIFGGDRNKFPFNDLFTFALK